VHAAVPQMCFWNKKRAVKKEAESNIHQGKFNSASFIPAGRNHAASAGGLADS
jgi:hypothetical protein